MRRPDPKLLVVLVVILLIGAYAYVRRTEPSREPVKVAERPSSTSGSSATPTAPAGQPAGRPDSEPDRVRLEQVKPVAETKPATFGARPTEVVVRVVRDEDGSPLADANVEPDGERGRLTDADGLVRVPVRNVVDVHSGPDASPSIRVSAPGRAPTTVIATIGRPKIDVRLVAAREVAVRLTDLHGALLEPSAIGFEGAGLMVTLALAGTCGSVGGSLDLRGAPPQRVTPASWKGEHFAWKIEVRGKEPTCLHAVLGGEILAAVPLPLEVREVDLAVDPAAFSRAAAPFDVRVVDASTRTPLADVRVVAKLLQGVEVVATTDADGRARFERVLGGEIALVVAVDGYVRAEQRVERPIRSEIGVQLEPGRTVRGIVVDENGGPRGFEKLGLYRVTQLGSKTRPIAIAESSGDGRFEFPGAPRDELVVVDLGGDEGIGFLPPRANLPATASVVAAGGDVAEVRVRAYEFDDRVTGLR